MAIRAHRASKLAFGHPGASRLKVAFWPSERIAPQSWIWAMRAHCAAKLGLETQAHRDSKLDLEDDAHATPKLDFLRPETSRPKVGCGSPYASARLWRALRFGSHGCANAAERKLERLVCRKEGTVFKRHPFSEFSPRATGFFNFQTFFGFSTLQQKCLPGMELGTQATSRF